MKPGSVISRLRTSWMRTFGGWSGVRPGAWLHWSVDFRQWRPGQIAVEAGCVIERHTWLNVPSAEAGAGVLSIGRGCAIGRNNVISAKNSIVIGEAVVTAPQVLIMDHAHAFEDVTRPILHQGVTEGGTIVVEPGCWVGFGACIVGNRGELRIGRNSIVAANSVVTASVPPATVVAGAPAQPVRAFNEATRTWERVERACP
ncbi:MAG TPA: acyltransferase [Phycisphaerales bacterium]|nr:acyltransferase [Phycisphaerales bacterium]